MDLFTLKATLGLVTTDYDKGIDAAQGKLGGFASYAKNALADIARYTAQMVVQFSRDVLTTGMNFDKQMSIVASYLGETEATAEHMAELRRLALDEARTSVFTGEEVGTAYEYMALAGWKYAELMAGLPAIVDAAAASGEDFAMVSDMVTDVMTAWGDEADQTQRYVDVLAQTTANSNTDFRKLGSSFKYVAPIAHTVGMSLEEAALFLGLMADNGIKATQAGTALRNILTRISTNAGMKDKGDRHWLGATEMLESLGVQVYDDLGNFRDWYDILVDLRAAWADESGELRKSFYERNTEEGMYHTGWSLWDIFAMGEDGQTQLIYTYDEAISTLNDDLETLSETYAKLSPEEVPAFLDENAEAFAAYGVSIKDVYGNYKDFNTIIEETRAAIGGLSDEEKMVAANRIASLRAMPAFIALLETDEETFNQLWESILNSEGAAGRMAQTRLDNLWGDIQMFQAAMDTLKITIFDDVKGPLRDVVQWGTEAITRIEDAVREGGIVGGIEQLATEINNLIPVITPILESLGKALVPILQTVFTQLLPSVIQLALNVGAAIANGIIDGITARVKEGSMLGQFLADQFTTGNALSFYGSNPDYSDAYQQGVEDAIGGFGSFTPGGYVPGFTESTDWTSEGTDAGTKFADGFGDSGTAAGEELAEGIQAELDTHTFAVDVSIDSIIGSFGSFVPGIDKHAKAMSGGRILTHASIFGVNGKGQPMLGGEAGPEAIVGVNSLHRMIQNSVEDVFKRQPQVVQPAPNVVLQMDGKTVARVQREHNASENTARVKAIALGYGR